MVFCPGDDSSTAIMQICSLWCKLLRTVQLMSCAVWGEALRQHVLLLQRAPHFKQMPGGGCACFQV